MPGQLYNLNAKYGTKEQLIELNRRVAAPAVSRGSRLHVATQAAAASCAGLLQLRLSPAGCQLLGA